MKVTLREAVPNVVVNLEASLGFKDKEIIFKPLKT